MRLILFIIIQLAALVYFVEMLRRVAKRAKEYDLKDTSRTLPFGFVRLRYVVILYVASYLLWVVVSILLYALFIHSGPTPFGGESEIMRSIELNL